MAHRNAWPFNQPVDPVALNIPDYLDVVKQPMDLGTVLKNLDAGEYEDGQELLADVALVWGNCLLYNPPEHPICQWARELSAYTAKLVAESEKRRKSEEESDLKRKAFVYPSPVSKKEVHTKRKKLEDMADGSYPEHQTQDQKWVEKYEQLRDFRDRFGHCRVPKMWDENLALGTWVHAMRQYKRKGKLSEERTQKLEELDFTWRIHSGASETGEDEELEVDDDDDEEEQHQPAAAAKVTPTRPKGRRKSAETEINDEIWEERYNDLVEYWKRFGHSKVPKKWEENPGLGAWVAQMRERKRAGKLDEEKVARLDKLDFTWNFQTQWEKTWEDRFEQLKKYKETTGTCSISKTDPAFKTLYQWVHDVRGNRRRGKLAADRVRRLDELGFVWNPSNPNAPTVPVPAGNFLTVKRKRGRPRKADVEAALLEANLWGMRVVEMEEIESDSDTETAEGEEEDDDDEDDGFDHFAEEDEEEADGEEGEERDEAGEQEGQDDGEGEGEEEVEGHQQQQQQQQQQNGHHLREEVEPEEEEEEEELTGDEMGEGAEEARTVPEPQQQQQQVASEFTTTTATVATTETGDEMEVETETENVGKGEEEEEENEEEEEEDHKTEPEDTMEDETEGEALDQEDEGEGANIVPRDYGRVHENEEDAEEEDEEDEEEE